MGSRRLSFFLLAALASGCMCSKKLEETPPSQGPVNVEASAADEEFLYAHLEARPAPAPARFEAPLPATVVAFGEAWGEDRPPRAYAHDMLCAGNGAMGDRLATAVDAARAAGATSLELASNHGRMIEYCSGPAFCRWAASQAADDARSEAFRSVLWVGLARCNADIVEPLLGRPGVPPTALVHFHRNRVFAQLGTSLAIPRGFADAVRAVVQVEGGYDAEHEATMAIDTLARMEGGASAILALHQELVAYRDRIGFALWDASDARLVRLFTDACARHPDARRCESRPERAVERAVPMALDELVRSHDFDEERYVADHPTERDVVLRSLDACAREDGESCSDCLTRLAHIDWARARAVAQARSTPTEDGNEEMVRTLRTYETPDGLGGHLVELGLLRTAPSGRPSLTVVDALLAGGVADVFDTETGQFPNEHDSLLRELAALAPDALPGVLFLEIPPDSRGGGIELDDGTELRPDNFDDEYAGDEEGPYTLVAYMNGEELRTTAENLGDWYDVGAVVGMLNELARRRGNETRWQVLPTGDQTAIVVAAPGPALRRAIREGLIEGVDADQARRDGVDFEERAIDAIRRQGL